MRVAINAQIIPGGVWGGVEQFISGLVSALGRLDGAEEYVIVASWSGSDWLRPYLGSNQTIVTCPRSLWSRIQPVFRFLGPWQVPTKQALRRIRRSIVSARAAKVRRSNGFYESLGVDVVHFPYQVFVDCNLPMIYNPHDLQHLWYPRFFSPEAIEEREAVYRMGCHYANAVGTPSRWVKEDIARQYAIDPQKIYAVPYGPPTELYGELTEQRVEDVASNFQLPRVFALYPAQTWRHKNHVRLLEALAMLRDRDGPAVNLICTGQRSEFWSEIEKHIRRLRLENQVRFLGFVDPLELRALYHLAQFVIHPSLFEGGGLPILEAFREGTPIACSAVTSFPEYAGEAALFFDPTSVEGIAESIYRMVTDSALRAELVQRGAERIRQFTWERTAKTYRAIYRKLGGSSLPDEDLALLASC